MVLETNEDFIIDEIEKQKRKLREISMALEQQNQLLRLIVQVGSIALDRWSSLNGDANFTFRFLENGNKNRGR